MYVDMIPRHDQFEIKIMQVLQLALTVGSLNKTDGLSKDQFVDEGYICSIFKKYLYEQVLSFVPEEPRCGSFASDYSEEPADESYTHQTI